MKNNRHHILEELNPVYSLMDRLCETTLLLEAMSLDDVYDKYYAGDIDRWSFDQIVHYDPTSKPNKKGRFTPWLLQMYKNDELAVHELPDLKKYLETFAQIKGADINKFKTINDFKSFVQPYIDDPDLLLSKSAIIRRMKELGADKVYEDNDWVVISPKTKEAAIYYGKGTKWCTAAIESANLFDNYHDKGDLYININKQTKDKYQFFFRANEYNNRTNEFKNASNHEVTNKEVGLSDSLIDFYISKYGLGFISFMGDEVERIIDKLPNKEEIYTPEFLRTAFEKNWNAMLRVIITGDFVIPEYVDLKGYIGLGGVFKGCNKMTSVTIPECFTEIPSHTFDECTNLREVHFPNTLKKIGFCAFNCCTSLTSISIPNSVTEIDDWGFSHCINLETAELPGSLKKIGRYSFSWCTNLSSITIPNSVVLIGDNAFSNCERLKSINIPPSLKEIEECLFSYSGLTSIEIPNGVTTIGKNAFSECKELQTVIIPESVKNFGEYAFLRCPKLTIYVSNQEQYDAVYELTRGRGNIQMIQDRPVQTESLYHGIMMEALEELLLEAMSLDDIHEKYYSDINKGVFDKIVSADPTSKPNKKGKYTEWLLNLYKGGKLKMEDLYKATGYLRAFSDFRHRLRGVDIGQIKSLPELYDTVRPFLDNPEQSTSKSDEIRKLKKGATKMYEDDRWLIIRPMTKDSAIYYGKGTQWCTAATESENYYDRYVEDYGEGCLYINIDKKKNRKYQFCFDSDEFMDERDDNLYDEGNDKSVAEQIGLNRGALSAYRKAVSTEDWCKLAFNDNTETFNFLFDNQSLMFCSSGCALYKIDWSEGEIKRVFSVPPSYHFESTFYNAIGVCDADGDYVDVYDIESDSLIFDHLKEEPMLPTQQRTIDFEDFGEYHVDDYIECSFNDIIKVHLYKNNDTNDYIIFYNLKERKWVSSVMKIEDNANTRIVMLPYYWIVNDDGQIMATSNRKFILRRVYYDDFCFCEITDCTTGKKNVVKTSPPCYVYEDSTTFHIKFGKWLCCPTLYTRNKGRFIITDTLTLMPQAEWSLQNLLKDHPLEPEHRKYLGKK